jgi:hypothetical protein
MGADERRASLRKVAEAIQLIKEEPDFEKKRIGTLFVEKALAEIEGDTIRSSQALEDAGNLTQAIALRDEWKWVTNMKAEMGHDINWDEGFNAFFKKYVDKMPTFKRRMLKPDVVFTLPLLGKGLDIGTYPREANNKLKLAEISIVDAPPNHACTITKVVDSLLTGKQLDQSELISLPKNLTVKVQCKNPVKRADKKVIEVKLFVLRGTKGTIVGFDRTTHTAEVELVLDNDMWPDAERLSNRVMIPMKDLRTPVKEVTRGNIEKRIPDTNLDNREQDEFIASPSGNGAHSEDNNF